MKYTPEPQQNRIKVNEIKLLKKKFSKKSRKTKKEQKKTKHYEKIK
jgi:hypothetical protein